MFTESRKINLIEEIIKENSEAILIKIETLLQKQTKVADKKPSAKDFLGVWSKENTVLINTAIEEGCEKIDVTDWK